MRRHDPGHYYAVDCYDGGGEQHIHFMKRVGEGYPGNEGASHGGTNCQELLRVLIDRVLYLDGQAPCIENVSILTSLRIALAEFERRAARRHGLPSQIGHPDLIEQYPTCRQCGHIVCNGHD